ncbi:sensor histidine kinase CheA associated with MCPs of class 40H [Geotalea daltonii FRC-32]|uniref:histidine kinase n=1 Tax=Geotalea daltonii (strain DSM 22248 / JCM 15807 / FRC-32) TaxID=316067 RepID=B9M917_GEODF|nr:chemotaxis protein CheA [Geotalea daltonii]ACM20513.1 sensor histidine kinase CheA associated with MCPs of class 40H [Geotalea daltonii FRC-32]
MAADTSIDKAAKDFLAEAEEIIDQLSLDLVSLSDCADSGDFNPDVVNSIFRGAHSLKGLAGMFGFTDIADLSHNMENLLDSLRLGKIPLNQNTISVLFDSMEILGSLVRGAGSADSGKTDISQTISRINACVALVQKDEGASPLTRLGLSERVLSSLTEYEEHRLLENVKKNKNIFSIQASFSLSTFDQDLGELTEILKGAGEVISTLPSAGGGLDSSINFEILFGSEKGTAEISLLIDRDNITVNQLGGKQPAVTAAKAKAEVVEEAEAEKESSVLPQEASLTAKSMSRTVRVDISKLDELMNIVGELVLSHSTISQIADRMRLEGYSAPAINLTKAAKGLERKLTELQKGVMEIRMIPVGQLFEKMARIVRKISREQGKKVELRLFGADTELDKLIIEDISDPMMHIIRNAIDHGIETPGERVRAGKDEKGIIKLSSYQKGNHVVIEVEDDGGGIDVDKVRRKAFDKGLIPSMESVHDREALDLIFLPGFSTSDEVSEISGRGVGMDVVRTNIAALSGMVDVESVPGKGSSIIITLPITLAIIKALIISSVGRIYALPITSVLETIMVERKDVRTVEKKEVIQLRETTLPLLRLGRFFETQSQIDQGENFYVVVVGAAEKRLGIVVDDLMGQQDIVIKSIGETFKNFKGISGAADLGDQRTILVLDVGGIINEAVRSGA